MQWTFHATETEPGTMFTSHTQRMPYWWPSGSGMLANISIHLQANIHLTPNRASGVCLVYVCLCAVFTVCFPFGVREEVKNEEEVYKIWDNTAHVEMSAPYHKCTVPKYSNGSVPFGTKLENFWNIFQSRHRKRSWVPVLFSGQEVAKLILGRLVTS